MYKPKKKRHVGYCKHYDKDLTFKEATKGHHCKKTVINCPYFLDYRGDGQGEGLKCKTAS